MSLQSMGVVRGFIPLSRMCERVERGRSDSDFTYFHDLMLLGEMLLKLTVLGLCAGVQDDADRTRYRFLHELVRASGVGNWADSLDALLTGPSFQHLSPELRAEVRALSEKNSGSWQ